MDVSQTFLNEFFLSCVIYLLLVTVSSSLKGPCGRGNSDLKWEAIVSLEC